MRFGNLDFAFAGQEVDDSHLAHVHAHRIGRAPELAVNGRQRGGGFLDVIICRRGTVREDQAV